MWFAEQCVLSCFQRLSLIGDAVRVAASLLSLPVAVTAAYARQVVGFPDDFVA